MPGWLLREAGPVVKEGEEEVVGEEHDFLDLSLPHACGFSACVEQGLALPFAGLARGHLATNKRHGKPEL